MLWGNVKPASKSDGANDGSAHLHQPLENRTHDASPFMFFLRLVRCRSMSELVRSLATQVVLLSVLLAFTLLGAQMFIAIEGPHESSVKSDVIELRSDVIDDLWNNSHRMSVSV